MHKWWRSIVYLLLLSCQWWVGRCPAPGWGQRVAWLLLDVHGSWAPGHNVQCTLHRTPPAGGHRCGSSHIPAGELFPSSWQALAGTGRASLQCMGHNVWGGKLHWRWGKGREGRAAAHRRILWDAWWARPVKNQLLLERSTSHFTQVQLVLCSLLWGIYIVLFQSINL